jgi:Cof subfamily protein (haloacid dehalogenase superfamily)
MAIELLALDLDHTTLTEERKIHPDNFAAVQRAVSAGIKVVLASGRMMLTMLPFADQLELTSPLICCNGALVVDESRETLFERVVPLEIFDLLLKYAEEKELQVNAYSKNELLILKSSGWLQEYSRRVRSVQPIHVTVEEARAKPLLKVLFLDDAEAVVRHRTNLEPLIRPELARVTVSEPEYLEFLPSNVSKGESLAFLAKRLGIEQTNVAAIGDFDNDVEMLAWAGLSAAVANASEPAKNAASILVSSNEDGGVAEFIDHYVLKA